MPRDSLSLKQIASNLMAHMPRQHALLISRGGLRQGALYMGAGALLSMAVNYAFNILAGRMLGPAGYGLIGILISSAMILSTLVFGGSTKAVAKYSSEFEAKQMPVFPVFVAGFKTHLILIAAFVIAAIALNSMMIRGFFDGKELLGQALIITVALYGISMFIGGMLQGLRALGVLGVYRLAQPLSRLLGFLVLSAVLSDRLAAAAVACVLTPLVGLWMAVPMLWRFRHRSLPVSGAFPIQTLLAFGLPASLLLGSSMLMANLAPLLAKWVAVEDQNVLAGSMVAALLIVRGPLFLFKALYDSLFPYASRAIAVGDYVQIRAYARKGILVSCLVMVVFAACILILGEGVIQAIFGPEFSASNADLLLLTLFSLFYFSGALLTDILAAAGRLWLTLISWAMGLLSTVMFCWLTSLEAGLRIEVGLALGAGITLVLLAKLYRSAFP